MPARRLWRPRVKLTSSLNVTYLVLRISGLVAVAPTSERPPTVMLPNPVAALFGASQGALNQRLCGTPVSGTVLPNNRRLYEKRIVLSTVGEKIRRSSTVNGLTVESLRLVYDSNVSGAMRRASSD